MSDLQQKLMGAAIVGAFTVAGDMAIDALSKQGVKLPGEDNKMIKMFAVGFAGSLLQQLILPRL